MPELEETLDDFIGGEGQQELSLDDFKPVELTASGRQVRKPTGSRRRGRPAKAPANTPNQPMPETLPPVSTSRDVSRILSDGRPSRPRFEDFAPRDYFGNRRPPEVDPALSRRVQLQREHENELLRIQRERENESLLKRAGRRVLTGGGATALQALRGVKAATDLDPTSAQDPNDPINAAISRMEQNLALEEQVDPSTGAKITRSVAQAATGLMPLLGAARVAGPILGPTAYTGLTSDWRRDPVGSALATATAFVPVKVGQTVSPLAARAALSLPARPAFQKAAQFGIEAGAGALANVGQYAATQGLLGRKVDPGEVAAQAVSGGVLSGALSPPIDVAARQPLPSLPSIADVKRQLVSAGIAEPIVGAPPSLPVGRIKPTDRFFPGVEFSVGQLPGQESTITFSPRAGLFGGVPLPIGDMQKDPVHWYYSAMERAIESKFPNKMQPDQAAAMLTNSKYGIKAEEYEWSGLDQLLASKAVRGEPITKQEILDTIRQNRVTVEEVVKGGTPGERIQRRASTTNPDQATYHDTTTGHIVVLPEWRDGGASVMADYERLATPEEAEIIRENQIPRTQEISELGVQLDMNRIQLEEIAQEMRDYHNRENAGYRLTPEENLEMAEFSRQSYDIERRNVELQARLQELEKENKGGTKFETLRALRGGKPGSYRELLLTVPNMEAQKLEAANKTRQAEIDTEKKRLREEGFKRTGQHDPSYFPDNIKAAFYALSEEASELRSQFGESRKGQFVNESHFSEPNIVVHTRFDEGTDAEGRRVLRIQEIQSDWHQQGREKGYRGYTRPDPVQAMSWVNIRQAPDGLWEAVEADGGLYETRRQGPARGHSREYVEEMLRRDLEYLNVSPIGEVPDAPFKSNWHELAFKRMLRWAADNGYQRIVWPKGRTQIDLYEEPGVRINVDRIVLKPSRVGKGYSYDLLGYRGEEEVSESLAVDEKWLEKRLGAKQTQELMTKLEGSRARQAEIDAAYNWQTAPVETLFTPDPDRAQQGRYKVTMPDGSKATFIGWTDSAARAQARKAYQDDPFMKGVVGEITGPDLSIGGRVHRALYDEKLPQLARDYAKKAGGQYGKIGVETGIEQKPRPAYQIITVDRIGGGQEYILRDANGVDPEEYGPFSRPQDAATALENLPLGDDARAETDYEEAHYLDITEKLAGQAKYEGFKLFTNPMFDPAAYRRFVGGLFQKGNRPADQPLTEEQKAALDPSDPNYEINLQRSQNQTRAQAAIDEIMQKAIAIGRSAQEMTAQEYKRSVDARTQARRRLRNLEALRETPEFLDPVRKADLESAIETARGDREASLQESQGARRKMLLAQAVATQQQARQMGVEAGRRLGRPEISYPLDPTRSPIEEVLYPGPSSLLRAFFRTMTDFMLAEGRPLDPNEYVTPQFVQWAREDQKPLAYLIPAIEAQGMDFPTFLDWITHTESMGGMSQREASAARRANNQMVAANPELAKQMEQFLPPLREINKMYRERSNLDRLMSIYSGTLTSLLETAYRNFESSGMVVGMDSLGQLFDSGIQYVFGSKAFDNKATLSPSLAIRPILNLYGEFARSVAGLNYKKNSGRVSRVMSAFEQAFPKEVQEPLVSIMNSDDEMAKLNGLESTPELLARWRREAEALPETYKRKPKLIDAITRAEKRYADLQSPLARGLIRGEKIVHFLNYFNRAQETIVRRAVFEAKVRRYATEAGYDIDEMVASGTVGKIPVEIVKRAADEALRLTFAKRADRPGKDTSAINDSLYYAHRALTRGPIGAAVKFALHPFVNFLGNIVKFAYDYSPAGLVGSPIFSAKERARIAKGDFSWLWKGLTGIALYGMFSQMRHDHYESQGSQMGPEEEPWWQKYPRKPWEMMGTPLKAGERWYEVQIAGRNLDLRFTPFGPAALLADMQERNRRGLGELETRDIVGALGGSMRGVDQLGDTIASTIQGIREAEKLADAGKISGRWLGTITAGFLTPLKYISDLSQAMGAEGEKIKRDVGQAEGFAGSVAAPVQERIPFLRQRLPEQEIPTREAAPVRSDALTRQLTGLPLVEPKNFLEQQLDTLGIKPFEIVPRIGNPKADRIINREMGKYMEGLSLSLSRNKDFAARRAEARRAVLLDEIFPAFHEAVRDQALAEVPEELLKAEILKEFTKEMRNVEDRRRRRAGKPSLAEEIKQRAGARPAATSPGLPPRPAYTPAPQPVVR